MKALAIICIHFLSVVLVTGQDYGNLCSLFKKNTKLRVPGSCNQYIVCNGESFQVLNCPNETKYDAKQQKCVTSSDNTELCESPCLNAKDGTFVVHPTDCNGLYYCKNKQRIETRCGRAGDHFDYDQQKCVYPRNSQCIQQLNGICDLLADKTLFRDETDCSKYIKCEKNKLTKVSCSKLYFNLETGKCAERYNVPCSAHRATADTCLKKKKPFVGRKADSATCRGYFICTSKGSYAHDLDPAWYLCDPGTFFDEAKQACRPAIDVKCNYNRCDGRGNATVVSGRNNCRNFLECQNHRVVKESTCDYHYFFDERVGACVPYIVYDEGCDNEKTHSKKYY